MPGDIQQDQISSWVDAVYQVGARLVDIPGSRA